MEEYAFKTEETMTLEVHKELNRFAQYANGVILAMKLLILLGAVCALFGSDQSSMKYFLLWAVLYLAFSFFSNRHLVKTQYKRSLMSNGGQQVHEVSYIHEGGIREVNSGNGNAYDYGFDLVRGIVETPNLLMLMLNYSSYLILDKRYIQGGSVEELKAYIFAHCPNIKKKKCKNTAAGKWIGRIVVAVLVLDIIMMLISIPKFSVVDKLSGKLTNDMSYQEMADSLASLDIHISERTITELEEYDANYLAEYGVDYYSDAYTSKAYDLLYWEGCGVYDQETWEWTPSESGVFWWDMEVWYLDYIYTDLFVGLSCMDPELAFYNIEEDFSAVDYDAGSGTVVVSFDLDGLHYKLEVPYDQDYVDHQIVADICQLLAQDASENDLYWCTDDEIGYLFYYGTEAEIQQLEKLTGLNFYGA